MRPITLVQAGVGDSVVIPLDIRITPFQVTVDCVVTGVATYSIQYTNDDIWDEDYEAASGTWYDMTDFTDVTDSKVGTLFSPVRAIRVSVSAGSGSVRARVVQAGN